MGYLGWYDDNPKHTVRDKVQNAIDAYVQRFGRRPAEVILSAADKAAAGVEAVNGAALRVEGYMRPGNFWVGE